MLVPQTIFIILTRGAPSANRQSQSPQVRCSRPAQPLDASSDISCAQVTWPHHANHKCIFQVVSSKHVFEIQSFIILKQFHLHFYHNTHHKNTQTSKFNFTIYLLLWSWTQEKHITTLPKTNIFAPENRPGPKRKFHIPTIHFQGLTVSFGECTMEIQFLIPNGPPRCCGQSLLRLKIGWKSMDGPSSTSKKTLPWGENHGVLVWSTAIQQPEFS